MWTAWQTGILAIVAAGWLPPAVPAHAQSSFYQGKRITLLVNFAPGGPTDVEGRLFARHVARHLPGAAPITVRNMEGAGGMSGANYLGEVAPRDGTTLGYFSSVPWIWLVTPSERRIAFDTFDFVAFQPGTAIHYMRTDVKPGIRSVEQLPGAEDIVVGGLSADNAKDVMMRLALELLGVRYKYVTSFPGSQGARLALERGEISYYAESAPTWRAMIAPSLAARGAVIPLYYDPGYAGGSFYVPKQVDGLGIAPYNEVHRRLKGADPTGIKWDVYRAALAVNNAMQRLVVLPPGSPRAAAEELRAAVEAMQKDGAYVEEATRLFGYAPEYMADASTPETVRRALRVAPEVKAFLLSFIATR